jgi:protein-L-isoaspartate O-methyltransferase
MPAVEASVLRDAMARRLYRGSVVTGEITIPAVPAMLDEYVHMCATLFGAVGRPFTEDQLEHLKTALEGQLAEAFSASPRSNIVISYNAPQGTVLNYHINAQWFTVAGAYENWTATREPPLFGTEPDARVMALANEVEDRGSYPILDIGAGTGRNALALARLGHPVDVVEMTPAFANEIRTEAERDSLNVRVIERDVFTTIDDLRRDYQLILLSEVVSDFRTTEQLRGLFELRCAVSTPGWPAALQRICRPPRLRAGRRSSPARPAVLHNHLHARRIRIRIGGAAASTHLRRAGIRLREGQPPCGRLATDGLV